MKIRYLGTAAAEATPALFCSCPVCTKAAQEGGKSIRRRASALINDNILIDLSPDIYFQKVSFGLDLTKIENLFVTHSHTDHFDSAELTRRSTANYCHIPNEQPLQIYGNEKVCSLGHDGLSLEFGAAEDSSLQFHILNPYDVVQIGTVSITALPAQHDPAEKCLIYLIQEDDTAILYANDTAPLKPEVFEAVRKTLRGVPLSLVSMDCTFGVKAHAPSTHMGMEENLAMRQALEEAGCTNPATRFLSTHFSHNCGMTHAPLQEVLNRYGLEAAFDGLIIDFN